MAGPVAHACSLDDSRIWPLLMRSSRAWTPLTLGCGPCSCAGNPAYHGAKRSAKKGAGKRARRSSR
jgi:hypothetical protein